MGEINHCFATEAERLMGRQLVHFDLTEAARAMFGQTLLVTGAGGSIGSEVCRMVAKLGIRCKLVLVDNSEFNLQAIDAEMGLAGVDRVALFADIRHASDLRPIFRLHRPEFVIHAAALKHVSVCEKNITEAVLTNVLGTKALLDAIGETESVRQALFLSTDKAVNPSTVLGSTKGLAEKLWLQAAYPVARLVNVLGSSGSVLPLFRKQALAGEAMTVVHSMRRYFMAPEEAAAALLVALTELGGPEIAIPDAGSPVWISDLARRVAAEAGVEPVLRFVAAGATEKETEQLIGEGEEFVRTIPGLTIMRRGVDRPANVERAAA